MPNATVPISGSVRISRSHNFSAEELAKRSSRSPDHEAENRAVALLCRSMVDTPDALFQQLVETVRDLCDADSAAITVLDPERPGVSCWQAVAGPSSLRAGDEVSHDTSLCELFLDHDGPLLLAEPLQTFAFSSTTDPSIVEALVAPIHVGGKLIGMIWAIAHSASRKFELEDHRLLTNLSAIAAAAHQTDIAMRTAEIGRADSERQGNERAAERRRAEGQLRLALDASSAGTWAWDPTTNQSDWDDRYHAMYQFAPDEPRTFENWISRIHPEDRPKVIARLDEILGTPSCAEWNLEFRAILPDRKIVWMQGIGRGLRNSSGQLVFMAGINLDITDRKRTEEALRQSEQRLRMVLDASAAGTWSWNLVTDQSEVDERHDAILRFAPDEPRTFEYRMNRIHPEDRARVDAQMRRVSLGEPGCDDWNVEFRVIPPDQQIVWVHALGRATRNANDQVVLLTGIILDITERKRIEEALRRSEENFRGFFENIAVGSAQVDAEGRFIRVNERYCQITGYTREELLSGMRVFDIDHPEDRDADIERLTPFLRGEAADYEVEKRYRRKDGGTVWVRVTASTVRDESGRFLCSAGIVQDITARKNAIEALRLSEQRLRAFLENSATIGWMKDDGGRYVFLSDTCQQQNDVCSEEWYGKTDFELWPKEIAEELTRNDQQVLAAKAGCEVIEKTIAPDGKKRFWLSHKFPFCDSDGKWFVGGLAVNVTARIESEKALKDLNATLEQTVSERTRDAVEREERLKAILNAAVDSILIIDRQGIIQALNPATETLFGFPAADLIGQHVGTLVATSAEWEQSDFAKTCLAYGVMNPQGIGREIIGRRRDDSNFPAEMSVSEIPNLNLFTCIIRDISLRKELEREVVEIASMEQRRIGQDLHDSVGQDLTALELLVGDLTDALKVKKSSGVDIVARMTEALRRCKTELRTVLRGLLPVSVDEFGLMAALSDLAERTRRDGKTNCTFDCPDPVASPDHVTATHVYLIAQEAVHNAVKHARPRNICISVRQDATHELILCVQDDGVGIMESNGREKGTEGLGLRIIHSRAAIIGATLTIERSRLHGTLVQCTLPRMNRVKKNDQEKGASVDRR